MTLRARVDRLHDRIGDCPGPGRLELITCVPAGCDAAEGQSPGTYFNADGAVATVVFAGPEPGVLAPLTDRLSPWGLTVVCRPG